MADTNLQDTRFRVAADGSRPSTAVIGGCAKTAYSLVQRGYMFNTA